MKVSPLVGADERLELADHGRALEVRELRVERAFDRGPSRHRYPDRLRGERLVGVHAGGRELDSLVADVPRRHHRIGRDLIEPLAERFVQPRVVEPRHRDEVAEPVVAISCDRIVRNFSSRSRVCSPGLISVSV